MSLNELHEMGLYLQARAAGLKPVEAHSLISAEVRASTLERRLQASEEFRAEFESLRAKYGGHLFDLGLCVLDQIRKKLKGDSASEDFLLKLFGHVNDTFNPGREVSVNAPQAQAPTTNLQVNVHQGGSDSPSVEDLRQRTQAILQALPPAPKLAAEKL